MDRLQQDIQIFYIHGFASYADSSTLRGIQLKYPNAIGLSYDCSRSFPVNLLYLLKQLDAIRPKKAIFIASSLGACYALHLCKILYWQQNECVFINPMLDPNLDSKIGHNYNFVTDEVFAITKEISESYKGWFTFINFNKQVPFICLLAKDDEEINYRETEKLLSGADVDIRYIDGGHRLEDYEELYKAVEDALKKFKEPKK